VTTDLDHNATVGMIGGAFMVPGLALLELDESCVITAASAELCRLLGRPISDLLGHSPCDFTHPDDVDDTRRCLDAIQGEPTTYFKRYLRPDGTVVPAHLSAIWLPERRRVLTHVADLTEVVADREALLHAKNHHEALVAHSTDLIFVIDAVGRLIEANPATVRLVGDHVGELAVPILRELVHLEDLEKVLESLATALVRPGQQDTVTCRVAVADRRWVTLEVVANNQLANPAVRGIIINARDVSEAAEFRQRTRATLRSLITALGRAAEYRDPYTAGHQTQVADLSFRIARHLHLPAAECELIELGANVHDIGKIAIPAEILTRPGRLSPLEYDMVKTHCRIGHDILATVDLPWQIPDMVLHHHERLDGSGYPDALAGEEISLPARIVAVADVIDAMASHRPYRPALGIDAARAEIQAGRATRYDAAVVDAALAVTSNFAETVSVNGDVWRDGQ